MLWTAHVDWITTTWSDSADKGDIFGASNLHDWACAQSGKKRSEQALDRWAWQGYIGWQSGQLSWGERFDGSILRVSGELAQRYWEQGLPIGHNVSRLDIAVDVWWGIDPDTMIAEHNVATLDARMLAKSRPWRVACVNGFGDGDTLYIGSRKSVEFVRIYNKEKESRGEDEYRGCTRYEVEYHDESARALVYRSGARRGGSGWLLGEVSSILHRRGVGVLASLLASEPINPPHRRVATSDERKIDWLRTQVAPTVRSLLTRHDAAVILTALGLDV
jgi:Replication initiation factor